MRIAVGQLWQETNTLNPCQTTRTDFEAMGVSRGRALVESMATTNELGGFIQSLRAWPESPEIVGMVRLPAWPSGTISKVTFEWLEQEVIAACATAGQVDGVLFALHGAMVAEGHSDVEGEILQRVRSHFGPGVPIVATLDLHAQVSPMMVENSNALVMYHTMPHVDIFETGQRAANVLRRILVDGARPCTAFQRIPVVLPAERADTEAETGFAVERKQRLANLEQNPHVLAAGVGVVQPWMDIPDLSSSVVVTTDGNPEQALKICSELAAGLWATRHEYLPELLSAEEAVARAWSDADNLTVLSDAADATTSGAAGDSIWVLEALLPFAWPRPALVTLVDPATVALTAPSDVGTPWQLELGGKRDTRFGKKLVVEAVFERAFDAQFTMSGHIGKNLPIDMGRSVVLRIQHVDLIVTSKTGPHFAPELFRAAGFDPFSASVVVAKSPCGFRAVYRQHAPQMLSVAAPGCAPADFYKLPFENITRPLWPWDDIDEWQPAPELLGNTPTA